MLSWSSKVKRKIQMNISKKILVGATAMAMTLGLIGCEGETSAEAAGKSIDQAAEKTVDVVKDMSKSVKESSEKAGDAISDSAITAKVKAVILAEPGLNVLDIGVDTKNNVTTLTGSIDSKMNSDKVEKIAGSVDGVMKVDNQLLVIASK
jgi:hyperosmotically inducible protein